MAAMMTAAGVGVATIALCEKDQVSGSAAGLSNRNYSTSAPATEGKVASTASVSRLMLPDSANPAGQLLEP